MTPDRQTQPARVLLISHDRVGTRMAGPGIRYHELARVLAAQQPVMLIAPQPIDIDTPGVESGSFTWGEAESLQTWLKRADVVIANGFVLQAHPELARLDVPLVLDLYDPVLLENLELFRHRPDPERAARFEHDRAALNAQFAAGDFFLCASERQRDLYLGAMLAAGRVTPMQTDSDPYLRRLIDVVPYGLPAEAPTRQRPALRGIVPRIDADSLLLLWAGGLWDWMDPLSLVAAMPQIVARHANVRLVFLAGQHPGSIHPMQMPARTSEQAAALGLRDSHIFFYADWVPYERRADFLLEADIAVSLHRDHLETHYAAVRSRILDHLWAGLPSILSDGDPAAHLLQTADAALVVPPDDPVAVATAIERLVSDSALRADMSQAAQQLAGTLTWEQVSTPLLHFCQAPYRTRPQVAQKPEQPPPEPEQPATLSAESPPTDPYALLEDCRNAAVAVQEQSWQLHEQPLPSGRLSRPRQLMIDQVVRPYLVPLLEQQQTYNMAVLRSIYAINETADLQRNQSQALNDILLQTIRQRVNEIHARIQPLEQRTNYLEIKNRVLGQQLRDIAEQLAGLEDADSQLLAAIQQIVASLDADDPQEAP